jgi:glycosyltransferase involved in cell wall biosynthesis
MKIVHVITKCNYGGAQSVLLELATYQILAGNSVTVVAGSSGLVFSKLQSFGAEVILIENFVHSFDPIKDFKAIIALRSLFSSSQPDLVHLHSSKAGFLGRLASCFSPNCVVYTAHGWPFQKGASLSQRIQSFAGEFVLRFSKSMVVCVSQSDFDLASRSFVVRGSRIRLIRNGIPSLPGGAERSVLERESDGLLTLVMVARFEAPKRQDLLIEAIAQSPGWRLVLLGDGPQLDNLRALVSKLDLESRVVFHGRIDPAESLHEADAVALLSDYEGLPLSVLEGMRAGLPVLASDLAGIGEAVVHGKNGFLVANEVTAVASYLNVLRDKSTRERFGRQGFKTWTQEFQSSKMGAEYESVYREVTAGCQMQSSGHAGRS